MTVLYSSSLTSSVAISAQNNFQGLIWGYIYRYTPRCYGRAMYWNCLHWGWRGWSMLPLQGNHARCCAAYR